MIVFWLVRRGQEIKIIRRQHFVEFTVIFVPGLSLPKSGDYMLLFPLFQLRKSFCI